MLGQAKTAFQAEIDAACELIDFWRFNVHYAKQITAEQPIANSRGVWNRTDHRPLEGFVYAITPFNFTAIAGNLPTAPALMGNTVLWKPSPTEQVAAHLTMELLGGDLLGVVDVEPQEVDQLARRVDLRLERGLRLAEHGRGVETLAPRAREQLGGLEQDGGALVERQGAPARRRLLGRGDRVTSVGLGGTLQHAEHVLVVVGLYDADLGPASHPLLPADGGGQLELAGLLELQLRLELGSFGGTRGVREVRLVQGSRRGRDGVHGPIVSDATRVAQVPVPSYGGPVAPRLTRRRGPGSR